ncbi:CRISPR-associated protein, Cas5d family [Anaerobranca gottschalkii DSM 13577]|uniref:pre-crRNA processing endonuclease n=2 Tax=Anaerobranca gottschalkii TaxID=108328 RepID=A0A1I0B9U9_9FIRM|nr:type I-C CRISPR-associated protein Cas5c [Anaerobranca gottschalkii]SET03574.1 CRISPR-associated protein, Cas5d family [Anaerobranca gottschalkii DSM 13577]
MSYGFKLKVWGDYACFTRPEMKVERVSYDVITPSAARGILEAIYWKPAIRWVIDRIHVINPIQFESIKRNEITKRISLQQVNSAIKGKNNTLYLNTNEDRAQRTTLLLKRVLYVVEAHFEMTDKKGPDDTEEKHYNIFLRRARKGQCYHRPYLGCREFAAHFQLLEGELPKSYYSEEEIIDLGWMLYDIDYERNFTPKFFRAEMRRGIIDLTKEVNTF